MTAKTKRQVDVVATGCDDELAHELFEACHFRTVECYRGDPDVKPHGTETWFDRELEECDLTVDMTEYLSCYETRDMPTCLRYERNGLEVVFSLNLGKTKIQCLGQDNTVVFVAEIAEQ